MPTPSQPKLYNPRHPERTLLYHTVAEHYETWLDLASSGQFDGQGDHHSPKTICVKELPNLRRCDQRGIASIPRWQKATVPWPTAFPASSLVLIRCRQPKRFVTQ